MKRICVGSLVAVLVVGILSISASGSVRLKGGYFMPRESYQVSGVKVPDNGLVYGAEITTTFLGKVGLGIGADYFQWKKTIENQEYTWQVVPALATLYLYPFGNLYLGAGAGYYLARTSPPWSISGDTALGSGIGYHGVIGYNITKHLFIEAKYSTCKVNNWKVTGISVESKISDVGGITFMLGLSI